MYIIYKQHIIIIIPPPSPAADSLILGDIDTFVKYLVNVIMSR
jgi:hypothetical protein